MKTKRHTSLQRKQALTGILFCLPLIFGLLVLFLPNMIRTVVFTLSDIHVTNGGYELSSVGFSNYVRALSNDAQYLLALKDELIKMLTQIPVTVIFSLFVAVLLNQQFRGRTVARLIFFLPVLLSTGVIAAVESGSGLLTSIDSGIQVNTIGSAENTGFIRELLLSLDVGAEIIDVIAVAADQVQTVIQSAGMQIFILLAGLQEISPSIYEAAKVEGCDGWQLFWKITFPMIAPQLVVCAIYTVANLYVQSEGTLSKYIDQVAYNQNEYGYATAMSLLYFLGVGMMLGLVAASIAWLRKKQ